MFSLTKGAFLALGLSAVAHSRVKIRADTNRDGDLTDDDDANKMDWTPTRGALFMANIGDSGGATIEGFELFSFDDVTTGLPWTNAAKDKILASTNDGNNDGDLLNPNYAASLRVFIDGHISEDATAEVTVLGDEEKPELTQLAKSKVRVWHNVGPNPRFLNNYAVQESNPHFKGAQLSPVINLAIDSRDVRRPDWDGTVIVKFTLKDGGVNFSDSVKLRVAPVLIDHNLQRPDAVFTVVGGLTPLQRAAQDKFVKVIEQCPKEPGVTVLSQFTSVNPFIRDWFVSGYTSIPGPGRVPQVLRLLIRANRGGYPDDLQVHNVKSENVGVVSPSTMERANQEGLGNLLIIPPYNNNPHGRAIMGTGRGSSDTAMMRFIGSQEVQVPMHAPDNSWLAVGHMDEYIAVLPCRVNTPACKARGWTLAVAHARHGWQIMQDAAGKNGDTIAFSRREQPGDPQPELLSAAQTVAQVVNFDNFNDATIKAEEKIKAALNIIKTETGITDDEIIWVPTVFYYPGQYFYRLDKSSKTNAVPSEGVISMYPNAVNGVSYKDKLFMTADPYGPVIKGEDVLKVATDAAFAAGGYKTKYVDTAQTHHRYKGDLHCGTNEVRRPNGAWWDYQPVSWPMEV